ncbi:MAG: DNA alkylation repair protein [Bacteroidales bacterium]|nr:DNA alkylation repair protein [Bacteroidales bacterium]
MKALLSEIRKKIRTRDNGPAVDSMKRLGIEYKTNHGLSIAEIKAIANQYLNHHELALELWEWDHREFKILATFIDDPQKTSIDQLNYWIKDVSNNELAEQLAINLVFRLPNAFQIVQDWLKNGSLYAKKTALTSLAWLAQRKPDLSDATLFQTIKLAFSVEKSEITIIKSLSFALRAVGKRNEYLNRKTIEIIKAIPDGDYGAKYIKEECLWELESDIIQERLKRL